MNSYVDDRFTAPRAKYGDESVYFDLKDLGNTTGSWDLYGSDSPSPYNGLQVCLPAICAVVFASYDALP